MQNFETFIGVDWSGAKTPKANRTIAVARAARHTTQVVLLPPPDGKSWSRADVAGYISRLLSKTGHRTLIGIDCNFGYARSVGERQFGQDYTYRDLWAAVEESSQHLEDFYAGGFWQDSRYKTAYWSHGKQNSFVLKRRETETACGKQGYSYPESPFKLIGPKQVGKGGLAGMRMALRLKQKHGNAVAVWPFESALANRARIVITEIYPRLFLRMAGQGSKKITRFQELETALKTFEAVPASGLRAFSDHESDALISAAGLRFLCRNEQETPEILTRPESMSAKAALREGWIFGVR